MRKAYKKDYKKRSMFATGCVNVSLILHIMLQTIHLLSTSGVIKVEMYVRGGYRFEREDAMKALIVGS